MKKCQESETKSSMQTQVLLMRQEQPQSSLVFFFTNLYSATYYFIWTVVISAPASHARRLDLYYMKQVGNNDGTCLTVFFYKLLKDVFATILHVVCVFCLFVFVLVKKGFI